MSAKIHSTKKRKQNHKTQRLLLGACLLLGIGILLVIVGAGYVVYSGYIAASDDVIVIPSELSAGEQQLVNLIFSGEQHSAQGQAEVLSLHLYPERTFQLQTVFVGRSDRPTVRTGRWYQLEGQLQLEVLELDGEPIRQDSLAFAVHESTLVAEQYDRAWFDYDEFVLIHSGEVPPNSAE